MKHGRPSLSIIISLAAAAIFSFPAAARECARCATAESLRLTFRALKFGESADRAKGAGKISDVLLLIEAFDQSRDRNELQSLVRLTGEALPYDPERALSYRLKLAVEKETAAGKSKILATAFDEFVRQIPDRCRRELFTSQIAVYTCTEGKDGGVAIDKKGKVARDCPKPFDFEACANIPSMGKKPKAPK